MPTKKSAKSETPLTIFLRKEDPKGVLWLRLPHGKDLSLCGSYYYVKFFDYLITHGEVSVTDPETKRDLFLSAFQAMKEKVKRDGAFFDEADPELEEFQRRDRIDNDLRVHDYQVEPVGERYLNDDSVFQPSSILPSPAPTPSIPTPPAPPTQTAESESPLSAREQFPEGQCLFCQGKSNARIECTHCAFEVTATCKKCQELGAPSIRYPRRMTQLIAKQKDAKTGKMKTLKRYVCYPQCCREIGYRCRRCERWFDKSMLHAFSRQEKNTQYGLCILCAEREQLTVCGSCHGVCSQREEHRDSESYKCRECFSRKNKFKSKDKGFPLITKSQQVRRTFGLELEINNVHRGDELSQAIADINVNGVEFNVKGDGSIHYGFEIVSFPAEKRLLLPATKGLCEIIRSFKHNHENAGLHIHIKDNVSSPCKFYQTWVAVEPLTFRFLPHFRRQTTYGKMQKNCSFAQLKSLKNTEDCLSVQRDRYMACNLYSLDKHKTIEIRCHHATSSYSSIYHWVQYLDAIYERSCDVTPDDLEELYKIARGELSDTEAFSLLTKLRVPAKTLRFYMKRKKFYDANPSRLPDDECMTRFEGDNAREPDYVMAAFRASTSRRNHQLVSYHRQLRRGRRADLAEMASALLDDTVAAPPSRAPVSNNVEINWNAGADVSNVIAPRRLLAQVNADNFLPMYGVGISTIIHPNIFIVEVAQGAITPTTAILDQGFRFDSHDLRDALSHAPEFASTNEVANAYERTISLCLHPVHGRVSDLPHLEQVPGLNLSLDPASAASSTRISVNSI